MSACTNVTGCFSRNAHRDIHIRQIVHAHAPARIVRCQAHSNAEPPHKADARGIFELCPPCCEATLLDARCLLSGLQRPFTFLLDVLLLPCVTSICFIRIFSSRHPLCRCTPPKHNTDPGPLTVSSSQASNTGDEVQLLLQGCSGDMQHPGQEQQEGLLCPVRL